MASGSEVAHSVLTGGFLIYVFVCVEVRTLETSCLKRALQHNCDFGRPGIQSIGEYFEALCENYHSFVH